MSSKKSTNHFVKGAAILGVAGLISKLLGAVYRIPYQNITGDIGLYVYMQVYPLYTTLLILATAGFPIAISKIVSERIAIGDYIGARKAFRISSLVLSVLGVFFFLLLYFGAPLISGLMGDKHLTMPLRAVAWSLPLVPAAAIMRGYFQGHQNMIPTGVSQVVEQLIRVIFILITAYWMMNAYHDAYLAGSGAVFAAFPGAVGACLVLLYYWRKYSKTPEWSPSPQHKQKVRPMTSKKVFHSLVFYALPICMGALVLPLIPLVDSVTVLNMMLWSGVEEQAAKLLKGAYDHGQPLIQFGTFFATSLSLALVPSISEAVTQGQHQVIANRTEVAIRLTMLLGLPASFGLALLAQPVNVMLFGDTSGTDALAIQAFTIVFATLGIATSGILQGLGLVMHPARHLAYGVLVKLVLNLALIPVWGISGAAVATVVAYVVPMVCNLRSIVKHTSVRMNKKQTVTKPVFAVLIMSVVVLLVEGLTSSIFRGTIGSERLFETVVALITIAFGGVSYLLALLWAGGLTSADLRFLPKGQRLIPLLQRVKLLRQ
ncbi:putative polysaccharide biosynthesis protein [Brevibacillus ginsengisoli]|uniref:putative polysaccharide biosynthesis protein n=1 Tax=Brevibacillus ginsengisoli TaxID=363854 RepID=UPI003CED0CDF